MASQGTESFTVGSLLSESPVSLRILLWSALLGLLFLVTLQGMRKSEIPAINAYRWDFIRKKAHTEYKKNARGLIADGFAKFHGPFRIITPVGSRIILPSSATDWVKNCKDLDHQALVHDDYFADYPGFEGQKVVTNPNRLLIDVTRTKLSQNAQSIRVMNEQLTDVLKETWKDQQDWHSVDWAKDTMKLISRMSAAIFVGPELAPNPEWQNLTITYTVNLFIAVGALRSWPGFMRPLINRILPQSEKCREQVRLTRKMMQGVLDKRARERDAALAEGRTPVKYEDTITWMEEAAEGRPLDQAAVQLAFAISALHTTSEAFRQVLLDLCLHPDLVQPLRDELKTAISESGWTITGLFKMHLLDSVMKESQRMKAAIVGIERKVIRDTIMPNGMKLPRGSIVAVDSSDMWNPDVHENPEIFDGYRFLRMREQGGKGSSTAPFVSSHKEHNVFGAGRFICPGRFFVANEMKIALAHVLVKYDMRLQDGQKPKDLQSGFYSSTDLTARVEVRRRNDDLDKVM